MNIFINLAIYQLVWFLAVLLENTGVILALPLLFLHLYLSPCRIDDVKLMGSLLLLGITVDGLLHNFGFISFNVTARPIPLWLAAIWLALATLPNHSLRWLKGRYLLSGCLGFFAGPLAYLAGVKLDAALFHQPLLISLTTFAVTWAALLPLIFYIAEKTNSSRNNLNLGEDHETNDQQLS